jgi:hypothetical protein
MKHNEFLTQATTKSVLPQQQQQQQPNSILYGKKNKTDLVKALSANKQGRCKHKFIGAWRSQDVFGEQVHFTFKGKRSYQTSIGALFSLIIKLIMVCFIAYEVYVIFARKHPAVAVKYVQNNLLANPGGLNAFETGFDIAFGFATSNSAILKQSGVK